MMKLNGNLQYLHLNENTMGYGIQKYTVVIIRDKKYSYTLIKKTRTS